MDVGAHLALVDELSTVVAAVGVEVDGEGPADALLVVGAAEVKEALEVGAATLGVGVGGHDEGDIGDIKEGTRRSGAPQVWASFRWSARDGSHAAWLENARSLGYFGL